MIPKGFFFSGISAGVKKNGKNDLGLVLFEKEVISAGLYTKNRVKSPSVTYTKRVIEKNYPGALLVVSGNANACVKDGMADIKTIVSALGSKLKIDPEKISFASTGVIGVKMPVNIIKASFENLIDNLKKDDFREFSSAIQTTDAFEKVSHRSFKTDDKKINILVLGKGAGMIAPDMATMLVFIFTDANISKDLLSSALKSAVDNSFNIISVDGDTSTNDMVLAFASGLAGNKLIDKKDENFKIFSENLSSACLDVAKLIVKDGEGATKIIKFILHGAKDRKSALKILKTVANSQLVKTAFYGCDPNWGRIMAGIGRSGVIIKEDKIDIDIAGMPVVRNGVEVKGFSEKKLKEKMKDDEVTVTINLNSGKESAVFYTSDLTTDYVKINSAYRT
ncbi:MAG: bifunctional glutamate N-acetyltransferase/amino-acid acetyltransferase ArgJ [Proteobacteria bacterium]|nr:bifunctional glutamate N-acetyltransferase/amino-acid acetyltransferase ArgJ [Pseudomonadota bacterium]